MQLWKRFNELLITRKLRLGPNAVLDVNGTEVDLTELAAINDIAAADLAKIDGITNGTAAANKALVLGASKEIATITTATITTLTTGAIASADSSLGIDGLAAAQGGDVVATGGTSSTAGNAGGASKIVGGTPGATGVGGPAQVVGAAGGATSGAGGPASVTGGAGTAGNSAGGPATVTGGAGQGTAAGGVASLVGGASGAGATGNGAAANVTGGAALSTNGSGGSVVMTPGAKNGTGTVGGIRAIGTQFFKQAAPAAKTTAATLTAAEILGGLLTANQGGAAAANYTLPLASDLDLACPYDIGTDEAFEFTLVNISTNAAEDITIVTNTGWTLVGNMVVASNNAATDQAWGTFRARRTAANTWVLYRVG